MEWVTTIAIYFKQETNINYFKSFALDVYYLHNLMEYVLLPIHKQSLILVKG
jgi:hypothetical protein